MLHVVLVLTAAQMDMPPGMLESMPKKAKPAPLDGDVPFIRCGTCRELAVRAHEKVSSLVEAQLPARTKKSRLEVRSGLGGLEEEVETILTSICNVDADAGKWLREYDIFKAGSKLQLKRMAQPGKCRRECRTIEKACAAVLETLSDHDLGEMLIAAAREKTPATDLGRQWCSKMAMVCKKGKTPVWPEGKARKNEEYVELTEEDLKSEETIRMASQAKGAHGLPMTAVNAADLDIEGLDMSKKDPRDELKDEI